MPCACCDRRLNNGMIHKVDIHNKEYKSCPNCSKTNGNEHVFHKYPDAFGQTDARITVNNPNGDQSYCTECRTLDIGEPSRVHSRGLLCSQLESI